METKPYSIQSPEQIAKDYSGNKQKIAMAMQMGIVDPTAGTLAGMFIDRMRSAQMQEQAPQQTVAQQVFAPPAPPAPMGGPQMPPQGAPMGPPAGLGATPEAAMMQAPMPEMPPQEPPMGMAEGGLATLSVPEDMFDEPDNGGYAGGGIIAFADGGMSNLYNAVEMAESGGNQNAVSPKGARGVMQLMPGTMRDPGFGVTPLRDNSEAENRRMGREYLDAMIRKYGNQTTALMAYNWGPGNVDKWLASGADIKKVPSETLNYVKKVMGGEAQPDAALGTAPSGAPTAPWGGTLASKVPGAFKDAEAYYSKYMPEMKNEGMKAMVEDARRTLDPEEQKKRRNEDKWATLAEIGFNMAGTDSPYLLQAVGKAAAAALPGARAAKKEREAEKRQAYRDLAEAEGITYKQAMDKANYIREVAKENYDISDRDITRAADQQKTVFTQGEETKRTAMQIEGQQRIAETTSDSYRKAETAQQALLERQAALEAPKEAREAAKNDPVYQQAIDGNKPAEATKRLRDLENDYYFRITGKNLYSAAPPASGNANKPAAASAGPKEGQKAKAANGRDMVFQSGQWVYVK